MTDNNEQATEPTRDQELAALYSQGITGLELVLLVAQIKMAQDNITECITEMLTAQMKGRRGSPWAESAARSGNTIKLRFEEIAALLKGAEDRAAAERQASGNVDNGQPAGTQASGKVADGTVPGGGSVLQRD